MRKHIGLVFIYSVLVALGVACGEMKKVDEMKDNTSDMRQTTKDLSQKTSELNQKVDGLLKLTREELLARLAQVSGGTESLFDAMRQGDTSGLRRVGMSEILKQTTLQGRIAEAGLYLQGFEFQVLRGVGRDDDPNFRAVLYHQAMLEFFLRIEEFAPKFAEIDPAAQPSVSDDEENRASVFNAIAFALHQVNRQQKPDADYGRTVSVYDLIMIALEMQPYIDRGQIVLPRGPSFIKEVLGNKRRVEQLLQARYNMFVYALVGTTTNLQEHGALAQAWKLMWKPRIDLSERTLGTAAIQRIGEEIMTPAARTARDMLNVGITPRFTKTTKFLLSRLNIQFNSPPEKTEFVRATSNEKVLADLWRQFTEPTLQQR